MGAAVTACIPQHLVDAARDRDGDGYVAWQLGGPDCDDADASVHPGANEVCGDGIDNDCDGVIDDDGVGALTWYPDLDGDGFGVDAPVSACVQPERHVASLANGIDCDDTNADIYPGAPDAWYDGVDSSCDGADDYDQDRDGYRSAEHHPDGDDCDDTNPDVNPGMEEICGNFIDDDCDSTHNDCAWPASSTLSARRHATLVWSADSPPPVQVAVGDVDGDGAADVLLGAFQSGSLYLFRSPLRDLSTTAFHADTHFQLTPPTNIFGLNPDLQGDLDGDGKADLLVGNTREDDWWLVRVFRGPFNSAMTPTDAARTYYGPNPDDVPSSGFGFFLRYLGDLSGEGYSSFYAMQGEPDPPRCYVQTGMGLATNIVGSAQITMENCVSVTAVPDIDEDGHRDLGIADEGAIVVTSMSVTGTVDALDGLRIELATEAEHRVSPAATADLDGDGVDDLAYTMNIEGQLWGWAGVAFGPITETPLRKLEVQPENAVDGDRLLPLVGDFNGDGLQDLGMVYIDADAGTGTATYTMLAFFGPVGDGLLRPSDADARVTIPLSEGILSLPRVADIDGDGFDDVVFGGFGIAYVLYGQGR